METYTTKKKGEQISFFVLPEEKTKIENLAKKLSRSISNLCRLIIMNNLEDLKE